MIFLLLKINGFEKPYERGLVRSVVLFTTILDSGEGNDRPMCKLGVRVNLQHIYWNRKRDWSYAYQRKHEFQKIKCSTASKGNPLRQLTENS